MGKNVVVKVMKGQLLQSDDLLFAVCPNVNNGFWSTVTFRRLLLTDSNVFEVAPKC